MNAKKVLAIAAAGVLLSTAAFAQTTDINALLAQIAQLQAQISALQGGSTGTSVTGIPAGYQFTAPMKTGSTGEAVKYLQMFLNSNPATTVALSGVGSKGNETMYYGPATAAAVAKYQNLNAVAILAPVGLTSGTGYFGAGTMAHVNAALKSTPVEDDFDFEDDTTSDDTSDDTTSGTEEGTFDTSVWSNPANNTSVKGSEEKNVYGIKVKTQSGSVTLKRFDVKFSNKTFTKYAEDVALYDGTEELYRFEGISAADLEEISSTVYRLRFPLNYKLDKNTTHYFYVKVKAKAIVSNGASVNMDIAQNDVRGVDSTGLNQYNTTAVAQRIFTFATENSASIEAANYPGLQDTVAQVSETATTEKIEIGKFNLKSKTVESTLKTLTLTMSSATAVGGYVAPGSVANIAYLYDGDTLVGSASLATSTAFTDMTVLLPVDTTKTFTVKVDVPEITTQGNYLSFALASLTAEDANLNAEALEAGSATGKYVHMYSYYPELALTSATITKTAGINGSSTDIAEGKIVFTVKAVGAPIYVTSTHTTGVSATSSLATAAQSLNLQSNATLSGGEYIVYSGETKNFTISDTLTPTVDGYYGVNMQWFKWGTTSASTAYSWTTTNYRVFADAWKTPTTYLDFRS